MEPILIIVPLLLVVGIFTAGAARSVVRAWLDHRVKLALLQKYNDRPELFGSPEELQELIDRQKDDHASRSPQDYRLTGAFLAVIGMGCTKFGERWDMGAEELMVEAFQECIQDAGIEKNEIQAAWLGTFYPEISVGPSGLPLSMSGGLGEQADDDATHLILLNELENSSDI